MPIRIYEVTLNAYEAAKVKKSPSPFEVNLDSAVHDMKPNVEICVSCFGDSLLSMDVGWEGIVHEKAQVFTCIEYPGLAVARDNWSGGVRLIVVLIGRSQFTDPFQPLKGELFIDQTVGFNSKKTHCKTNRPHSSKLDSGLVIFSISGVIQVHVKHFLFTELLLQLVSLRLLYDWSIKP